MSPTRRDVLKSLAIATAAVALPKPALATPDIFESDATIDDAIYDHLTSFEALSDRIVAEHAEIQERLVTHANHAGIWLEASGAPGMHSAEAYELADARARIEGLERLIHEIASQREKLERERDDWKDAAQREGEASRELRHLLKQSQDLALPAQVSPHARTEPLEVTHGPQRPADAPHATESGVSAWERLRRLLAGR